MKINKEMMEAQRSSDRDEISDIERGNPVRTYVGMSFDAVRVMGQWGRIQLQRSRT